MLKERLLHTPEGVRDIYNGECIKKLVLQDKIHNVLKLYGYNDIQTPTFEFFDVFNKERGSVASNEMFKFFDNYGNTMVLRPDMTPAIARIAAKYFGESSLTHKLCYMGNTFVNNHNYQGRLKETTQIGAELIGESSIYADAEIISMVIDSLLNSGLKDFQIEIGHAQFMHGLISETIIDSDLELEVIELLKNKNYYGVEELLKNNSLDTKLADTLLSLSKLFGSYEIFDEVNNLTLNKDSLEAVNYLKDLYELIKGYGYEKYITIDLGMLSNHNYYTGIMFKGYTYGTGDSIVQGGRYDKLIGQFGVDKPSIGFSLTVDQLMVALDRQKIDIPVEINGALVVYSDSMWSDALKYAKKMREMNNNINMIANTNNDEKCFVDIAKSSRMNRIVIFADGKVKLINTDDNAVSEYAAAEFLKTVEV